MERTIQVTLKKSPIGSKPIHRANLHGLGLKKMHQTVQREDTPQVRGMIRRVAHMVEVG